MSLGWSTLARWANYPRVADQLDKGDQETVSGHQTSSPYSQTRPRLYVTFVPGPWWHTNTIARLISARLLLLEYSFGRYDHNLLTLATFLDLDLRSLYSTILSDPIPVTFVRHTRSST